MACVNADGTLTASGQAILTAVQHPGSPEAVAAATGLPLFRVRSALRELEAAHRVVPVGDGTFRAEEPAQG